jgi:hypothetical protein
MRDPWILVSMKNRLSGCSHVRADHDQHGLSVEREAGITAAAALARKMHTKRGDVQH